MPVDVGQSAFEAVVIVSEALVVQAEEVEDGRMEIIYGGDILFRLPTKGISGAIGCLLYTSPSPRDLSTSRMPSSA